MRLADAFAQLGRGSLTFVGDGPLRAQLEGRERVRVVGRVPHDDVPAWLSAADVVCGPALIEPFGQALLEAMACERSVVATRIGGPPEFVPARCRRARRPARRRRACAGARDGRAPALAERRGARGRGDARPQDAGGSGGGDPPASRSRSASLISTSGRIVSASPCSDRQGQRPLVALADLLGRDALLEPVVARSPAGRGSSGVRRCRPRA